MVISNQGSASPPSSFSNTWNADPKYVVKLEVVESGGASSTFESSIEETLSVNLGSQWSAPFENILGDLAKAGAGAAGIPGKVTGGVDLAGKALGLQVKRRETSAQIWQSSDPMQLTIPFTFIAVNNARKDVRDKAVALLKMVAPSQEGMLLKAPGPTIVGSVVGGRDITLYIGEFVKLAKCIITDVQVQFDNVIGAEGIPLRAKVNVGIKSWYSCFTIQDIESMFP